MKKGHFKRTFRELYDVSKMSFIKVCIKVTRSSSLWPDTFHRFVACRSSG